MEIYIPFNVPSSKNSRVWTGTHSVSSKSVNKWRKDTKPYWIKYKQQFLEATKDIEHPLFIHIVFIRKGRHRFDYINPCQTIMDEMVHQGWLTDDNSDVVVPIFGKYKYDKVNHGVIIRIAKLPKYEFI